MSSDRPHDSVIRSHRHGATGHVIIDNLVKHNAMSFDMWDSLPGHLAALDDDPEVRVIVLQGAGDRAFASGSDISQFGERRNTPEGVALYNATVDRAVASLGAVRKPTVARIQGYCFGGGVGLALHCDLRYATPDATFCIPAGKVGVGYHELWLQRLTWLVGPANAKEIMFTARRYDAEEAVRMGLVNRLLGEDEVTALVDGMARLAPLTARSSKLSIETAIAPSAQGRAACQASILQCFESQDYIEGRNAFTEKRTPTFVGR